MIKVQKYTPRVYYNNSRDFQALGRICEVLYNYILMNVDIMKGLPLSDNIDQSLMDLVLLTIGFDKHHNYTNVDLVKLAEIFKSIMRVKGTETSIREIVYLLLRSQSIEDEDFILDIHSLTGGFRNDDWKPSENKVDTLSIDLYVSNKLKDIILIEDVFDYILPAGFIYHIYQSTAFGNMYETVRKTDSYVLNMGVGTNTSRQFGQIFDSQFINDNNPIVNTPEISRTFTTRVVSSDDINSNQEFDPIIEPESEEE